MQVFENFTYRRQLASDDGLKAVLELSAQVNGKHLKGIDIAQINDDGDGDGEGIDFEVMLRLLSGLQALGEQKGKRMAPYRVLLKGEKV